MQSWKLLAPAGFLLLIAAIGISAGGEPGMLAAGLALGVLIATVVVMVNATRRLGAVVEAAQHLADGDFAARVDDSASGATGELAQTFNRMAERVQSHMGQASQERGRLAAALNSSIDAVAALDRDGRILFANVGFERTFGRPYQEIAGEPLVWVLADEQVLDAIRDSRDRGMRQIKLIERPGRQFLQVVTTPIEGGGDWSVLMVCHDLTDVKRTEQIRRDFVANVSHELRTPLAAIKSVVETLAEGAMQDENVAQEFLRRADGEVDRLVLLVEELLELSRIESGDQPLVREDTGVAALLEDAVRRMQSQAERAEVELRLEPVAAGKAYIDAARIERAVINLVQNALKFTPAGGSVTVSAALSDESIEVQVRDTGIGIQSADLPRVFERFYKVDQSRASVGSGLGLALVKHAVEAHGGSVGVTSVLGEGSTFRIVIPLVPEATA